MLNGLEMNDVVGIWQLADQTKAKLVEEEETAQGARVSGHHSGYTRFDRTATVHRTVQLFNGKCVIKDRVSGSAGRWTVRWTFDPSVTISSASAHGATILRNGEQFRLCLVGASKTATGTTWVSTSYGIRHEASYLDVEIDSNDCELIIYATK
jgi:hypothetical protein